MSEERWYRGTAQELVQVESNSQGGQTLHVGTVDKLLPTDDMRLQDRTEDKVTATCLG